MTYLHDLFAPIEPYATGYLRVSDEHTLYWEECGNPTGEPVLFLHGGPGGGCCAAHRQFFDPRFWRIILFDQRGCGRSRPLYELQHNTTAHIIADIEQLRTERNIDRWHLFGGSWGSTLALAYAQKHPTACKSLTLRGLCLFQKSEIDWFLYGMREIFPEAWDRFVSILPDKEKSDVLEDYYQIFTGSDNRLKNQARKAWMTYETSCATLYPQPLRPELEKEELVSALPDIECHYFRNNLFTPDTKLYDDIDLIRSIPTVIVHGRYDIICPIKTLFELHKKWPELNVKIIPDAGHSVFETGIRSALIETMENVRSQCSA